MDFELRPGRGSRSMTDLIVEKSMPGVSLQLVIARSLIKTGPTADARRTG